jgi:hypothetical protein
MLRFTTATVLALAISFPLSALAAERAVDQKAPQAAVVAAAPQDAVMIPANAAKAEAPASTEKAPKRLVPHGSSQSAASYRFTSPYAVPPQTLPLAFPSLSVFNF